jgi:hypothetical protein
LFHPLLFEVHSLKLLATHALVHSTGKDIILAIFRYSIICHVFSYIKHLSNHTNRIPSIYLLHIFTLFLLHVSLYHTPSSGTTQCPLLLHCCYYGRCVMKYTRYNFAVLNLQ